MDFNKYHADLVRCLKFFFFKTMFFLGLDCSINVDEEKGVKAANSRYKLARGAPMDVQIEAHL